MSKPRSIQVIPRDKSQDDKIDLIAERLRTSRSGLAGIALDFVVGAIERGEAVVTNGEVLVQPAKSKAA